jgi:geranylgeranyl pyrophosphate synthase
MTFNEKYSKIKQLCQKELSKIEAKMVSDIEVKEPLNTYLKAFLTAPSKRIRSLLTILYAKSNGKELSDEQLELLSVIEIIHNASLIHDDVIDESKLRRSHKTLSEEFDNKLAVISGDYLLAIALKKLVKISNLEILENLTQTIRQMCIGEINQNFERFHIGTLENYIDKTKNKTAYLFESALVCCAILDGISDLNTIRDFALNVGIAFQVRDDLKNIIKTDFGKPVENDITDGIYNAPIIFAQSVEDYSSGIEKTKILLNNYVKDAEKTIEDFPQSTYKDALEELLELLNNV